MISGIFPSSTHRVYRLEIAHFSGVYSVMLVFSTQLSDLYSPQLPLSSALWLPLDPSIPCVKVQSIHTVCGWEGVGGECWRPYSAGVLHSVSDQIQNLQNCSTIPKREGSLGYTPPQHCPFQVSVIWYTDNNRR